MSPVTLFLVCIAGIFLIGTLGEVVFKRTRVPDVLWLILTGLVLGPASHLVGREQLLEVAPYFSALTLVFVLFEGGSRLDLMQLSKSAPRALLLSALSFVFSTVGVMLVSRLLVEAGLLPAAWTWRQELMLGAILGGTSPIVLMPAMQRAGVEPAAGDLVSLEAALRDVLCIVAVSTFIEILLGETGAGASWSVLPRTLGLGLLLGAAAGLGWLLLLRWLRDSEHVYPITLAALLLLYVVVEGAGGSAALGVLAFAVVVGNAGHIRYLVKLPVQLELHGDVQGFHSQMVFIVKSFFFTFIGAMLGPPWGLAAAGAMLAAVLLVVRYPAAWLALQHTALGPGLRRLVYLSVPRGVAAGVLATLPMSSGVPGMQELPVVVFACVFSTVLIFALGFPLAVHRQPAAAGAAAAE